MGGWVAVSRDKDRRSIRLIQLHYTIRDLETYKGWGHSSWKQAVDVAIVSKSKRLILFHYAPSYDDSQVEANEKNAQKQFLNTTASYQGLSITL